MSLGGRAAGVAAVGVLVLGVCVPAEVAHAQSPVPAEELYTDYFGCWTCHGPRGQGGDGRPLRGTYLPLSMFIKELRLPAGEMPPFGDLLATDEELTAVYVWLEGADEVEAPLPLTVTLTGWERLGADPSGEVTITTRAAGPDPSVRHRMTLMSRDNSVIGDQAFELQASGSTQWVSHATDRYGQASWDVARDGVATTRLRLALPPGAYVLVVEAVEAENPDNPTIVGVGSAVLRVE